VRVRAVRVLVVVAMMAMTRVMAKVMDDFVQKDPQ
jgi:hypothetical protein